MNKIIYPTASNSNACIHWVSFLFFALNNLVKCCWYLTLIFCGNIINGFRRVKHLHSLSDQFRLNVL